MTRGVDPAWSPDGSQLAFAGDYPASGIRLATGGAAPRRLTMFGASPAWSPDGRRLVYTIGADLFVIPADGGAEQRITSGPGSDVAPDWSPDGTRIAYGYGDEIWTISPDGRDPRRVASGHSPSWSPDGGSIAFERDGQLYVVAADGANERRLRSGFAPAWSPDGRLLVFAIRGDVCALDLATGRARAVVYDVETSDRYYGNAKPAWQPTGASAGSLSQHPCENGKARLRLSLRAEPAHPSPGRQVTFVATVRNLGPDAGASAVTVDTAGAALYTTQRFRIGPCGRERPEGGRSMLRPGECAIEEYVVRATEPGRIYASAWRRSEQEGAPDASLTVVVAGCTVLGTRGRDVIVGTKRRDVLCGDFGNDLIRGRGGGDSIYGGPGDDRLDGGDGNDTIHGGPGLDRIAGGAGADSISGGGLKDVIAGGAGDDRLYGDRFPNEPDIASGKDTIDGGAGNDLVDGGRDGDLLYGGAGADVLLARDGNGERVDCGPGRDSAFVDNGSIGAPDVVRHCERVQRG